MFACLPVRSLLITSEEKEIREIYWKHLVCNPALFVHNNFVLPISFLHLNVLHSGTFAGRWLWFYELFVLYCLSESIKFGW